MLYKYILNIDSLGEHTIWDQKSAYCISVIIDLTLKAMSQTSKCECVFKC